MGQEMLKILQGAGRKDMELQIALQCAPLFAGLKLSNLLMISSVDLEKMSGIIKETGICYFVVASTHGKTAVLLFDRKQLGFYLREEEVWQIFRHIGYQGQGLGDVLHAFRKRYEGYFRGEQDFPHEMGLLLGYPVEDVKGFIRNGGRNCLYTGYWKVYENLSEKMALFREFEKARDALISLLSDGLGIVEIIQEHLLVNNSVPL